ncbi:MAG: outer membrane beta-barrel protein, partial [Ferruginibacter sp.]
MRKSFLLIIISTCFFIACATTAMGQKENKSFSVGFGLEGGLPLGDIKDAYKFDGGLTIRLSYHVGPGFATLTTGALAFLPKSDLGDNTKATLQIPVKAGYKYVFSKPFFVMGELGYSSFKVYSGSNGEVVSSNVGGFTYAPSVGVNFKAF